MNILKYIILPILAFTTGFMLMYVSVRYIENEKTYATVDNKNTNQKYAGKENDQNQKKDLEKNVNKNNNLGPENKLEYINNNPEIKKEESLNSKKEELTSDKEERLGKKILVNLESKKITLISNGVDFKTFDIVTTGKPNSYYETPVGDFYIKNKNKNRYSTMGEVYMPYAMQFYGNFFIHGIPYHKNGERVTSSYSGGCVRVADNDMLEIYNFTDINTKISLINKNSNYEISSAVNQDLSKNMLIILVSLETLNQEKFVTFQGKGIKIKDLNYYIAQNNVEAKNIIYNYLGKSVFDTYAKERLVSVGIESDSVEFENRSDIEKFTNYIINHKSFILSYL